MKNFCYAYLCKFQPIFDDFRNKTKHIFLQISGCRSHFQSKTPTVFLESSIEISNFLKTSKHSNFTPKIPKILFRYHKQAIFLRVLRRLFQKSNCANFDPFLTIFELQLNSFSCRFRAAEVTSDLIFSITSTVFPKSPTEISQFLKIQKKSDFTLNFSKILLPDPKHTIFLKSARQDL